MCAFVKRALYYVCSLHSISKTLYFKRHALYTFCIDITLLLNILFRIKSATNKETEVRLRRHSFRNTTHT